MFITKVSLPKEYRPNKKYPLILLNDGEIYYLDLLKEKAIIIGLISDKRIDDFTPWKAENIKPGMPDFGGMADEYHKILFNSTLPELLSKYSIDTDKIAYGGYSLGGLAAIYSMSTTLVPNIIFSICGSFWYPGFVRFCLDTSFKNMDASVYLQNGKTEGSKHNNILSDSPMLCAKVHSILSKKLNDVTSIFDDYAHHEHLKKRYEELSKWLIERLCI